jgi:hypothetical protein
LSGLELHFMRRSSSCIRSSDGTSSRFAAISAAAAAAAATGRAARLCSCRCSAVEVGCSGSQLGRVEEGFPWAFSSYTDKLCN